MKGSEWFHGDTYVFVYDLQANVLLNPAFPAREGTNVKGQKDANGKAFHDAIIRTAEIEGSGWVDYLFPKPGQAQPSQKWACPGFDLSQDFGPFGNRTTDVMMARRGQEHVVKRNRFTDEQIAFAFKEVESRRQA